MKVLYKTKHVKTVPAKYAGLDICVYLEDIDHIRLSESERKNLDIALLDNEIDELKACVKDTVLWDRVQYAAPVVAVAVQTKHELYYIIRFSCNVELRCSAQLFKTFPVKEQIKRLV